jgi:hypothetical protein
MFIVVVFITFLTNPTHAPQILTSGKHYNTEDECATMGRWVKATYERQAKEDGGALDVRWVCAKVIP